MNFLLAHTIITVPFAVFLGDFGRTVTDSELRLRSHSFIFIRSGEKNKKNNYRRSFNPCRNVLRRETQGSPVINTPNQLDPDYCRLIFFINRPEYCRPRLVGPCRRRCPPLSERLVHGERTLEGLLRLPPLLLSTFLFQSRFRRTHWIRPYFYRRPA